MNIIINAIKQHSKNRSFPDKTTYTGISVKDIEEISTEFRIKTRDIELTALESDIIPDRYVRNMKSFSLKDQIILLKSAVAIIGLGGLGGAVV